MTPSRSSHTCAANADSASLTPDTWDSSPRSAAATQITNAPICLALASPTGWVAQVEISPRRDNVDADKRSELLTLIGSWAGDDFQSCLDLVYEARSTVERDDVPS